MSVPPGSPTDLPVRNENDLKTFTIFGVQARMETGNQINENVPIRVSKIF